MLRGLLVGAALLGTGMGVEPAAADETSMLSLRLDWLSVGYHGPIFLAAEKGWFRRAGLGVTIVDGTGSATTVQLVGTGQFDVGHAALSNMAFARSKGIPVVSIAGLLRKSDLGLMVPNDSSIRSPADLAGKRLVYTAGSLEAPFLDAFLGAGGIKREQVPLLGVDASAKISAYLTGNVEGVFSSAVYVLPLVERQRPSRALLFSDFGLPLPGFGLFASKPVLARKGEAIRKFASIVAGSWGYVADGHEDEAVQAIMAQRPQARLDPTVLRGQLDRAVSFIHTAATETAPMGVQAEADWAAAITVMEKAKTIDPGSKPADYFTNDYLDPAIFKSISGM